MKLVSDKVVGHNILIEQGFWSSPSELLSAEKLVSGLRYFVVPLKFHPLGSASRREKREERDKG